MLGEILDGKYRIDRQLGAGGMGNVYLATHLGTTRVVAVKVIAPKWAADPRFLARFQREAQACGRLRHPNIVNVTDFGIAKSNRGDMPYLVMEFLDGQTLSDFQKATPVIPLPLIADLLDQIALALSEAHRHGIVHRDLKPDNIWLEPNGRGSYTVKVLDFGVAKLNTIGGWTEPVRAMSQGDRTPTPTFTPTPTSTPTDDMETVAIPALPAPAAEAETVAMITAPSDSSGSFDSSSGAQTMPGSLVGTPAYMSPEQAFGEPIDFRSDIYSLAVVAYLLVSGTLPFGGNSTQLFKYHQLGNPPWPTGPQPIPPDVVAAIIAGLKRNPADRPPSAVDFARRFHNAVDAEFLALRRSKAFLLRHLLGFAIMLLPIYGAILAIAAILMGVGNKLLPFAPVRVLLIPFVVAGLFIFGDNLLRAAAAAMAVDERPGIRRFQAFRVFWRLVRMLPTLTKTQFRAFVTTGPGWIVGDCLWPVLCFAENISGKAALERSRDLMTGLRSAGRALAIRHFALAAFAIADVVKSLAFLWRNVPLKQANVVITATWFPIFALFAAAPLYLYDRTAPNETGPLLQLDRTPEIRITGHSLSTGSTLWLAAAALDILWQPIKAWLFGPG